MDDVQSWPEVPSIAHFCSLFRAAFNLLDFDIEELEEALLTDGAEDAGSSLLQELIVRLLCGCIQNNEISTFNYQMFLRRLFRTKCQEYGRDNPFNTDIDFQFLPLRVKVEIVDALTDFRLDAPDVPDLLRKKRIKERKKRRKEDKRRRRPSTDSEPEIQQRGEGVWQVVCYTESDWEALAAKLKGSSCRVERELHRTLVEDFLPEIPRLFAEKERQQRRRMMDYQPRRQSTRLEKLKQKESQDTVLAREDEDKLRLERGERERRERLMMRAARRSPGSGWGDSAGSDNEKDQDEGDAEGRPGKDGRPAGRQTNNSLSSATGQIIIQPPKRKKLRSKQVFKTSIEDLRTGMYKILEYVKSQDDAWPFVTPVDEHFAPRYYSVIRRPMDLRQMEDNLDKGEYTDLNHFRDDFQLIVDNCRQYNGSENEYTEMVNNLLESFNEAIDRYLESDPSSDEEVAVDFAARIDRPRHKERKRREHKESKRLKGKRKRREKEREKTETGSESDFDHQPPSLKAQRDRSSMSDKSGSVPGSDFDDREPDFLRVTSPPRLEKPPPKSDSDSESDSLPLGRPGRGRHRRVDIEDLNAATAETLKSITSMLEDMPLGSGFSSNSNSPHHFHNDFPPEPRPIKHEKPYRHARDPVRRRKHMDLLRPAKRKDIRTIERLQPGKSKGNLIVNLPKPKDHAEESGSSMGLSRMMKESRNALLVKTGDSGPKLSLGTVLTSDILDFGKSKHSFDAMEVEVPDDTSPPIDSDVKLDKPFDEVENSPKGPPQPEIPTLLPEEKEEESIINKENDPVIEKHKELVTGTEEKKRDAVKEITNKGTPNASAWFKAFGAPKAPTTVKKKPEAPEPPPVVEEKESSWGASTVVSGPVGPRRQRKASSSSSVSEPSSLSQDSPLHPVSPGLVSPRGEPPPPPVNGTLRVGFYQDMSSAHKCSPEKQSPHSTHSSPREVSNPSPFQGYSHVYPPSSPGAYANFIAPTAAPPAPLMQPQPISHTPPTSLYDNITQYQSYSDQYRQPPVRTLESYVYKPPEPAPKPSPSIFPVKKRLFTANVDVSRPSDVSKEQTPQSDLGINRSIYKDTIDRYTMDGSYQQRPMGQYGPTLQDDKMADLSRLHQSESETMQSTRHPVSQTDLSRLSMPPDVSRTVGQEDPSRYHSDMMAMADGKSKYPGADRSLSAMIESLGRMPSPGRGFATPLERLMQPPMNTIQEDSDGVFRNKYAADNAYTAVQRHQPPVSTAYTSPSLSHIVDRYEDDRLLSNPYYDKNMYLKNVTTSSSLPMYQDQNPQAGYELNIPKPRDPKPIKRKKGIKGTEAGGTTAFQQYVGLKPTEPSVPPISLKTTAAVPGSAFNFGPGLNNSLYSEGYLDELRQPAYYGMVGGEKPAFLAPPARGASYPLPQYMGHQSGLVDGYQQYLQRMQEEQLRLAYPAGYHAALGIRPAFDRPSWL